MKALTISIQDNTYQELKRITGQRQISQFIDKLITEEIKRKKQRLIEDYKSFARSKAMKKEDKVREGARGREIKKTRPSLIVSNDVQNEFDDQIIVVPFTTEEIEKVRFFEILVDKNQENGLEEPSKILCNRLQTIDKVVRLKGFMGTVNTEIMKEVEKSLKTVLVLE